MRRIGFVFVVLMLAGCLESQSMSDSKSKSHASQEKATVLSGFDIDGNSKECGKMAEDTMCTMMMTDNDYYAQECRKQGFEAFQCGCHDWICSEKIEYSKSAKSH